MKASDRAATWELSGPLTFQEVPRRYEASLSWYQAAGLPEAIDLGRLDDTDSSALALLLEWQSWASRDGRELHFLNPPRALADYARLTDADALLGWRDENE